jgi:Family of unknown function (DUF5995)
MQGLSERVARVPADRTVAEVVARLTDIETQLDGFFAPGGPGVPPDGVACFNGMYLKVTEAVRDALPTFENQAFIERLDILFAQFYFDAYDAAAAQAWVSKAWEPLFARRAEHRLALQFAIAGMNAHINNDLAHALVLTWHEFGFDAATRSDYDKINDILEAVEKDIKAPLSDPFIAEVDTAFGTADDFLALWSIRHARDQAWERARIMQHVQGKELDGLFDRIVGFAGNLLLGPAV